MAQIGYSDSQRARAAILVEHAKTWTRGTRKRDGLPFILFPSSKPGHAYYTTETACSCQGFYYRGACAHVLAVQIEAERLADIDTAVYLAFAELALSKRGDQAGAAITRYERYFGTED